MQAIALQDMVESDSRMPHDMWKLVSKINTQVLSHTP